MPWDWKADLAYLVRRYKYGKEITENTCEKCGHHSDKNPYYGSGVVRRVGKHADRQDVKNRLTPVYRCMGHFYTENTSPVHFVPDKIVITPEAAAAFRSKAQGHGRECTPIMTIFKHASEENAANCVPRGE